MARRDIVVIGASSGGVELLLNLVPELPPHFPASLFVALHTAAEFLSPLPELLSARGRIPAVHPLHGDPIAPGRIYVAPPDNHLILRPGFVEVVRGPKENGHRPAVDALFRTASRAYGPRVVAVVLSGHQDCGTAGVLSVRARGGISVVQDPATAVAPAMPESVIRRAAADHVVHPVELPGLLMRLVAETVEEAEAPPPDVAALEEGAPLGERADVVCPLCHGALSEAAVGAFTHFRCHEGHAFSLQSLARHQGDEVERALWAAARALDEGAALSRRLSVSGSRQLRSRFADKEATQARQAEVIRRLLLEPEAPTPAPVGEGDGDAPGS